VPDVRHFYFNIRVKFGSWGNNTLLKPVEPSTVYIRLVIKAFEKCLITLVPSSEIGLYATVPSELLRIKIVSMINFFVTFK